jgi:hypothetical protein
MLTFLTSSPPTIDTSKYPGIVRFAVPLFENSSFMSDLL